MLDRERTLTPAAYSRIRVSNHVEKRARLRGRLTHARRKTSVRECMHEIPFSASIEPPEKFSRCDPIRFDRSQKRNKVSRRRHVLNPDTRIVTEYGIGSVGTRWGQTIGVLLQVGDPCWTVYYGNVEMKFWKQQS
jgi:hypothetical protein